MSQRSGTSEFSVQTLHFHIKLNIIALIPFKLKNRMYKHSIFIIKDLTSIPFEALNAGTVPWRHASSFPWWMKTVLPPGRQCFDLNADYRTQRAYEMTSRRVATKNVSVIFTSLTWIKYFRRLLPTDETGEWWIFYQTCEFVQGKTWRKSDGIIVWSTN